MTNIMENEGGLRTIGLKKETTSNLKLITIVTVVYNNVFSIEETINSIINQTYKNFEYIIIDGGSTDGTVDIIKKYDKKIDYWLSEKDSGLYYAMNKGLELAKGDWINFMNSGDCFSTNTIIEDIFTNKFESGVIYGDVNFSFDGKHNVYVKAESLKYLWKGMRFVHQTAFISTNLMRKFPFETKYRFIADYNSIYQIYLTGAEFHYVNYPVCDFLAGGLSDNNPKSILECQKMIFAIHKQIRVRFYYYYRFVQCTFRYNIAKILGQSNYAILRRIKNRLIKGSSMHN